AGCEKFKQMVTSVYGQINQKYKDIIKCRDFVHYIICCNNPPLSVEPSARRFMMVLVSNLFIGNKEYHKAFRTWMKDNANDVFDYLANYEMPDNELSDRDYIPVTNLLADLKIRSFPQPLRFFRHMLSNLTTDEDKKTLGSGTVHFTSP